METKSYHVTRSQHELLNELDRIIEAFNTGKSKPPTAFWLTPAQVKELENAIDPAITRRKTNIIDTRTRELVKLNGFLFYRYIQIKPTGDTK